MSQKLKGFTIHEGYTDLGTLSVKIDCVENPVLPEITGNAEPQASRFCLFRLLDTEGNPLPDGIRAEFKMDMPGDDETFISYTSQGGFVGFNAPVFPIVPRPSEGRFLIQVELTPAYENRSQECYLEVLDASSNLRYTLSGDLGVSGGYLGVYTDDVSFYRLAQTIAIGSTIGAVGMDADGHISVYNTSTSSWGFLTTLEFTQIQHPENLESVAEGIYKTTDTTGTLTSGELLDDAFERFSLSVQNPGNYFFDLNLQVYVELGLSPIYANKHENLIPGNRNYIPVTVEYTGDAKPDTSPLIADVEAVGDLTFSTSFKDFLGAKSLSRLESLAAAGPINYLIDLPELTADDEKMQAYVDVFSVTGNLEQAQRIISVGYTNLYDIANTPRSKFVQDVSDEPEPVVNIYRAAQIHHTVAQQVRLLSGILANATTDFRMDESVFGTDGTILSERNRFGEHFVNTYFSSCSCDDCKSGVSPFAYLTDLVRYGAVHITKTGSGAYSPTNYAGFLELLSDKFLQPYDTLPITCDTLHDEYCRVRLVTEVLEKLVINLGGSITTARLQQLEAERKSYLQVTYNTLLSQAGTSFAEVRDVFITVDADVKKEKAQKLADKLSIPLYIPGSTTDYTADVLWLSLDNSDTNHDLTADKLQEIFGFRNTLLPVTDVPLPSFLEQWRTVNLRNVWRNADYPLSVYTREGVEGTGSGWVYQAHWKPIVDPDIMGLGDMTYLPDSDVKDLWKYRKQYVDTFLDYYVSNSTILSETAADMQKRMVRVQGINLTGHIFDEDIVKLYDGTDFITFHLLKRGIQGTVTDFYLKSGQSEPAMFQPDLPSPVMRYHRRVKVTNTPVAGTTMTLNVAEGFTALSGGYLKFGSSAVTTHAYENQSAEIDWEITAVTYVSPTEIEVELSDLPSPTFMSGELYVAYEVEVALVSGIYPDPEKIVARLLNAGPTPTEGYEFYPGGGAPVFDYDVWSVPTWPVELGSGTDYEKLKALRDAVEADESENETYLDIIHNNLGMDLTSFTRMMLLFGVIDAYGASSFTAPAPTSGELYELASLLFVAAKRVLAPEWVTEEMEYDLDPGAGTTPLMVRLLASRFAKSVEEPVLGSWDSGLQALPGKPLIDPEILKRQDMQEGIGQESYLNLYNTRKDDLEIKKVAYLDSLTGIYDFDVFDDIFLEIRDGITPGPTPLGLATLLANWNSSDSFVKEAAAQDILTDFGMDGETFALLMEARANYQNADLAVHPSAFELDKCAKLFTTAYKVKQLYGGWVTAESGINYYDVLKMRMAPGRGDYALRFEWQHTLEAWNNVPVVEPDIVGAENIKTFLNGNEVHDEWVSFRNALYNATGTYTVMLNDISSGIVDARWENYVMYLCKAFFNEKIDLVSASGYISYFESIQTREEAGEDIRPLLGYLGVTITQYRSLQRVYEVMKGVIDASGSSFPLQDSEYTEVCDALITIRKQKEMYGLRKIQQFDEDIILCSDEFKIYKPDTVNFPLTDLPVYNENRFPQKARKEWLDLLESRNDREAFAVAEWETVLEETEDRTLRVLRDALIRALSKDCEPFDVAAERLAKTLFIETKDNCCAKHTRVSQAIETLQGFIFSLKGGIFDNYLAGFSLSAPNFDKEWEWLGSYATWRAAVFTYLYPENLLYPTLRRKQSSGFRNVVQVLQDSSRFSPQDACALGKEYQAYFQDIVGLEMQFTTSADSVSFMENADGCCEETYQKQYTDFYFATSGFSGKHYWSSRLHADTTATSHTFWQELPIDPKCKLVGCFPLFLKPDGSERALHLFYSYMDEGKLKLAYLKKKTTSAGDWSDENEVDDLPDTYGDGKAYVVTACQSYIDWDWPSFVLGYNSGSQSLHMHLRYWYDDNKWEAASASTAIYAAKNQKPITAVRHALGNASLFYGLSVVFSDKLSIKSFGQGNPAGMWSQEIPWPGHQHIIGAFQSNATSFSHTVQVAFWDENDLGLKYSNIVVSQAAASFPSAPVTLPFTAGGRLTNICPTFRERHMAALGANVYEGICLSMEPSYPGGLLTFINKINLIPSMREGYIVPVQSGDCIVDFSQRITAIREYMILPNLIAFTGASSAGVIQAYTVAECIKEAYYFVPMLLALDQQQRGQYESALDWYRSVYDYTVNNSQRKVYYGLVMEETIANVYTRPADWLLDPLNPHLIAQNRANAYTKYTVMNVAQCLLAYADREYTLDTVESVPRARILYTTALDLLGVRELKQAPGLCENLVQCFDTPIQHEDASTAALFTVLQTQLSSLGNANLIAEAKENIEEILADEELDVLERFTQAFEAIEDAREPHVVEDLTAVVSGSSERFSDLFRYFAAFPSLQTQLGQTVQQFGGEYSWIMTQIMDVDMTELESEETLARMTWLTTDSDAGQPYQFTFADADGHQRLSGERAYNPLMPTRTAFTANLTLANATVFADTLTTIRPAGRDYIPLIDVRYCIPTNPVYDGLRLKANLELYKIQNCRNIAGMVRELDVYAAPTDSTTGIPIIGAGGTLVLPGLSKYKPSQYRFKVLVERAKQLVSQAQQMESLFLSALEKRDAEYYSELKARQDLQTAKATVKLQDLRVNQANDERTMASLQLDRANFSYQTYQNWISSGLNSFEQQSLGMLQAAFILQYTASGLNAAASVASAFMNYGAALGFLAEVSSSVAGALSTQSSYYAQMASFQRRAEEWQYQKDLANFDISIANQQIKIAEDNIRIVSQERQIAQLGTDHAYDTLEFLKNKFTNAELYNWMSNILERSYAYLLNLATSVARTAEGQLYFERQEQAGPFILDDYWESTGSGFGATGTGAVTPDRRGLTGSTRLLMDLTRLDQYAFDTDKRKLQLTKTLSLAQNFPVEFQQFRETGVLNFELNDSLFDYDFPGHYLRLIHGVKTTVVGLVPVYGGIKATLTAEPTSYTVIGGNTFQRIPIKRLEVDSVALTSPNSANGLFEMQPMQNEMLNPFEGMGVQSRWEFKMPKFSNRMDYDQIADVLITVEYTALDSFQYRYQVLQNLDTSPSFNRAYSFRNNFPDQWFDLCNAQEGSDTFGVTFKTKREDFPQGFSDIRFGGRMLLYFVREDGFTDEVEIQNFRYVMGPQVMPPLEGETANGLFVPGSLSNQLTGSPFRTWILDFENNFTNRELFSTGQIKDILFVLTCVGDLPTYPL